MFNLFRRSRNKTKSNNNNNNNTRAQHVDYNEGTTPKTEIYRPLSEDEREYSAGLGPRVKASIDELEDLHDLAEFSAAKEHNEEESRERERPIKYARNKNKQKSPKNSDNFYFNDEVNIANTAPNFTANKAATTETTASTATDNEAAERRFGMPHSASCGDRYVQLRNLATVLERSKINAATWHEQNEQQPSGSSRNELAERQGRVCIGGNIFKNNSSNNNNKSNNNNNKNKTTIEHSEAKENVEPVEQLATNTTTTVTATTPAPSWNEPVKYRNSKKTPKNADNAHKRQSWLGQTLNNVRNRHKEDTEKAQKVVENRCENEEISGRKATARKSFFLSKSAKSSNDNDKNASTSTSNATIEKNRPSSRELSHNAAAVEADTETKWFGAERKLLNPLEKSRDFLSEILMARGRNHKRHNQQQQQQQQQQKQLQQYKQRQKQLQQQQQHAKTLQTNELLASAVAANTCSSSSTTATSSCSISNHNNHPAPLNISADDVLVAVADPTPHSTHLESLNCDRASNVAANSYQMTKSNNSSRNSNSQSASSEPQFSDSAAESGQCSDKLEPAPDEQARATAAESKSSRSEHRECADAISHDEFDATDLATQLSLHSRTLESASITETPNIERNAFATAREDSSRILSEPHASLVCEAKHNPNNASERVSSLASRTSTTSTAVKNQLNELTECDRDSWLQRGKVDDDDVKDQVKSFAMGQSNAKPETPTSTRATTPRREFRESVVLNNVTQTSNADAHSSEAKTKVVLPTITVVDYSASDTGDKSPVEKDVFYDFESGPRKNGPAKQTSDNEGGLSISVVEEEDELDDNVFHDSDSNNKWQFINTGNGRHSLGPLQDVREEDEEEEEDEQEDGDKEVDEEADVEASEDEEEEEIDDEEEDDDADEETDEEDDADQADSEECAKRADARDPDHGRPHLKSTNSNDSNLSSSFHDSGIGSESFSARAGSPAKVLTLDSCDLLNESFGNTINTSNSNANSAIKLPPPPLLKAHSLPPPHPSSPVHSTHAATHSQPTQQRLPFVRDGNSTDCDESLMQCDDFDFVADADADQALQPDERLVCIESISLPDVVVESTGNNTSNNNNNNNNNSSSLSSITSAGSEHLININGATGNSIGNVHFVPIHVEGGGDSSSVGGHKRRSLDDSVIGGKKSFGHYNGHHAARTTVEITAEDDDDDEAQQAKNGLLKAAHEHSIKEKMKRELVDQESRYSAQIEDAQKNAYNLQTKVNEMQTRLENMEKELALKTWHVDRLQGELVAAHKDDEYVRKRLKLLEDEKTNLRHKYCDNEEELNRKYEDLEQEYKELEEKYKQTRQLASNLQTQFAVAQSDAEQCREEMEQLRLEMEEQVRILRNALENSEAERKISEDKWQKEFEMLRNQNQDREESLMTDCEWQLRQMQRACKEKIDKAEHGRREALERTDTLECAAQERLRELQQLRPFEAEVKSLRGLANEQEQSLLSLKDQIEALRNDLQTANENLEEQIEAVRMIKYQCDNKMYDKERELIQRIDDVRNEAAAFWENKLYTEMTRLKSELESVYIDERRDALDKLQTEHIEELRALTTRYTANEEELRAELAELQERLDQRDSEFLELREKTDNTLLQTRMHLDRADREYQNAMFREEARREALEESLRKEFEEEKLEMEEKFRERLGQVKEEFNIELQMSTQEMVEQHRKELVKQKVKLQAEKDEALQELTERHRKKLANAEEKMKDIELGHQRDLKDLKADYDADKAALDKRDISNANEIEQLHRKCRCLTNLFEEMRMRYERRDPRQEDLREIGELRSRCESQERDLYLLTDRLREMQIQMEEMAQRNGDISAKKSAKAVRKPPPKSIPTNCDVIYEENEERDSPPPTTTTRVENPVENKEESDEDEEEEDEEEEEEDDAEVDVKNETVEVPSRQAQNNEVNQTFSNKSSFRSNKNKSTNNKCSDHINEDDGHMITAV